MTYAYGPKVKNTENIYKFLEAITIRTILIQPLEKAMATTPVLLPGKSHGRRSLVGCRPWGREESDTTERLSSSSIQPYSIFKAILTTDMSHKTFYMLKDIRCSVI